MNQPVVYKIRRDPSTRSNPDPAREGVKYADTQETQDTQDIHETQDSYDTHEASRPSIVTTLNDAIQHALSDRSIDRNMFTLARALRSLEKHIGRKLSKNEQRAAFTGWWSATGDPLAGLDFQSYKLDFLDRFKKTRVPLGASSLLDAMHKAEFGILPQFQKHGPKVGKLLTVCFHLQHVAGGAFFLSVRDTAKILGEKNLQRTNSILNGMVEEGMLVRLEKGTKVGRLASRYLLPKNFPLTPTHPITTIQ